jgi:hypothetical protein
LTRPLALILAAAIVIGTLATGRGSSLAMSIMRGFGWGIGREVAHGLFRR